VGVPCSTIRRRKHEKVGMEKAVLVMTRRTESMHPLLPWNVIMPGRVPQSQE
jgi:hypothetical protein